MKIFFDCTFTYHSGLNTGIQRVVRNIISRNILYKEKYNIDTLPVISFGGYYFEIEREFILNVRPVTASVGQKIKNAFDKLRNGTLKQFKFNSISYMLTHTIFKFLEFFLKKLFWIIKGLRVFRTILISGYKKVSFSKEDKLVLLDAFWTYEIGKSIDNSNLSRNQIVSLIYDLIPLTHPDFVEKLDKEHFMKNLPVLALKVRRFIGISKSVADELNLFFKRNYQNHNFEIDYFLLGSDFQPRFGKNAPSLRPLYKENFNGSPVWLVVGTIEPRKNHSFILDAFELLWKGGANDKLLVIGRIGWKCDDILNRFQHHPELNSKLFVYVDANDDELSYAYSHSEGLIFASFVEGFGLPIVEAMGSGIKVLCSDIPVFREVGGDYPHYFDLSSKYCLVDKINFTRGMKENNKKKWMTWDESADIFFGKILAGLK